MIVLLWDLFCKFVDYVKKFAKVLHLRDESCRSQMQYWTWLVDLLIMMLSSKGVCTSSCVFMFFGQKGSEFIVSPCDLSIVCSFDSCIGKCFYVKKFWGFIPIEIILLSEILESKTCLSTHHIACNFSFFVFFLYLNFKSLFILLFLLTIE